MSKGKIYGDRAYDLQNKFCTAIEAIYANVNRNHDSHDYLVSRLNFEVYDNKHYKRLSDKVKSAIRQADRSLFRYTSQMSIYAAYVLHDGTIVPMVGCIDGPHREDIINRNFSHTASLWIGTTDKIFMSHPE